jgi:5-azacytidine-induced protein 1
MEELLNLSSVDLAHQVLTLRLQLEEKSNSINLLQETLNQQRELTVRNTKNADRDMKTKLREQKEEYEATIARHQKFIDQVSNKDGKLLPHLNLLKAILQHCRSSS